MRKFSKIPSFFPSLNLSLRIHNLSTREVCQHNHEIASLSNAGKIASARKLFDKMLNRDVVTWNSIITAHWQNNDLPESKKLFASMPEKNVVSWNTMIAGCLSNCLVDEAFSYFLKMPERNVASWNAIISGLVKFDRMDDAEKLFDEMPIKNVISYTAMVDGFARNGRVGCARKLFDMMPGRNFVSWAAMISGYVENGMFSEAVMLFRRMQRENVRPNPTTVTCMLSACGHLGMLQLGKWIHGYVIKNQICVCDFVSNSLIDMYGKCGSLKEAGFIFGTLSKRRLTAWNSMINCLALHGHSESAITVFKAMEGQGPEPDEITFVGILGACTHAGLVDEGISYFNSMIRDYGIELKIEHYGCAIDLLCRAGRFEEALGIVRDMKIEPDEVVWGSLLNGCGIHGNYDLAEFAVKRLLEIDPNNADYGNMLVNLYSKHGKWEQVEHVRKMLKDVGGKKLPGCSWIELDSRVHQFYSGDKVHPEADEICWVLEELAGLMET